MKKYFLPLALLFFVGCNNQSQTNEVQTPTLSEETIAETTTPTEENTTQEIQADNTAVEPTATTAEVKVPEAPKAEPVAKTPPAKVEKAPAVAKEPVKPKAEAPKPAPAAVAVDGSVVFAQKCASCHGIKAEKSALGKSQIIAGWSAQQVEDALNGYKDGSYGKEMKALMQGQAKGLSADQLKAVAQHISTL